MKPKNKTDTNGDLAKIIKDLKRDTEGSKEEDNMIIESIEKGDFTFDEIEEA